jgi:hypothetical protein
MEKLFQEQRKELFEYSPPFRRGALPRAGWGGLRLDKPTTPSPDALRLCRIGLDPPLLAGGEFC